MKEQYTLINNTAQQRFEFNIAGTTAYAEYTLQPGVVILPHVCVPSQLEGQGIGSALVRAVLEELRHQGVRIVPECTFVAQYICRHPEWEEMIYKKEEIIK